MADVIKGDLAVIIHALSPEMRTNVGAFVDVLEPATPNQYGMKRWYVRSRSPLLMYHPILGLRTKPAGVRCVCEHIALHPIRPGKSPVHTTTPKELETS